MQIKRSLNVKRTEWVFINYQLLVDFNIRCFYNYFFPNIFEQSPTVYYGKWMPWNEHSADMIRYSPWFLRWTQCRFTNRSSIVGYIFYFQMFWTSVKIYKKSCNRLTVWRLAAILKNDQELYKILYLSQVFVVCLLQFVFIMEFTLNWKSLHGEYLVLFSLNAHANFGSWWTYATLYNRQTMFLFSFLYHK